MLCAYLKPWAEGFLQRIDSLAWRARLAARTGVIACEIHPCTASNLITLPSDNSERQMLHPDFSAHS